MMCKGQVATPEFRRHAHYRGVLLLNRKMGRLGVMVVQPRGCRDVEMHILICVIAANMRMGKGRYALQEREKEQQ